MSISRGMCLIAGTMKRRHFLEGSAAILASAGFATEAKAAGFQLRYIVGSSMYGELPLAEILPDVRKTGARHLDLWPRKHGNQREQVDEMGEEKFAALLTEHEVKLGCSTRYDLGPLGLQEEMKFVSRLGGDLLISGGKGPKGLQGEDLKAAVNAFCEELKPHAAAALAAGVRIGIENHGNNLIDSPDSLKWLAELRPNETIGAAVAPYHLENLGHDAAAIADLLRSLGDRTFMFYAWQYGQGCMKPMPKELELLQMPGRGDLDFAPLLAALKEGNYQGYTEIFMHPTPRGIPILPTGKMVTAEIIKARKYLESLLGESSRDAG